MRKQVRINAEQLPCLPRSLPSTIHKAMNLVMKAENIRKHTPRWQPCMCLCESSASPIDLADGLITGIASSDPCRKPKRILLSRD